MSPSAQLKGKIHIFLSYARADKEQVCQLYDKLAAAGFRPWMDVKDIRAGQNWQYAIKKAMQQADLLLVCLSHSSIDKRGFIQKEIRDALDIQAKIPDKDVFIIPIRIEACEVPDQLEKYQWVDLFEKGGYEKLENDIRDLLESINEQQTKPSIKVSEAGYDRPYYMRRIPIYILFDCSELMTGVYLEKVVATINTLLLDLKSDANMLESAYLSAITFGSAAEQARPLTELMHFQLPELKARAGRKLGAALELLNQSMDREVVKSTSHSKGDWKPWVVLFISGPATDSWEKAMENIKQREIRGFIACAVTSDVDRSMLARMTEVVVDLENVRTVFKTAFKWWSEAVEQIASKPAVSLPPPPPAITIVPSRDETFTPANYTTRRLPFYLLLDCSAEMAGEPIEAIRQGVRALVADLRSDPQALETAHLSVITFNNTAQQLCPLTELMQFKEPNLDASEGRAFGAALKLLDQCIDREFRQTTSTQKGDWLPLVFLIISGQSTDRWEEAADRIKYRIAQREIGNFIACPAGSRADTNMLKRITENVIELDKMQPDLLKSFFKWVSAPIKTTPQNMVQVATNTSINLPPPPPDIRIVP